MCIPSHGGQALATHRYAIGRLFKSLHSSINNLYYYHPTTPSHSLQIRAVNASFKLIYHLITTFPQLVDVRTKLGVMQGGTHLHLIALTRLAFSDRIWLEEGIEIEVCDGAHRLLDEWLSPDEGEALLQMFSSGNSEG